MKLKNCFRSTILLLYFLLSTIDVQTHNAHHQDTIRTPHPNDTTLVRDSTYNIIYSFPHKKGGINKAHSLKRVMLDGKEIVPDSINKNFMDPSKIKRVDATLKGDSLSLFFYTE